MYVRVRPEALQVRFGPALYRPQSEREHARAEYKLDEASLPSGSGDGWAAGPRADSVQFPDAQSRLALSRPAGRGMLYGGHWLGIWVLTGSLLTV